MPTRLDDFLTRPLPPDQPLAEQLLHVGDLVVLAARRRHGKTSFLLQLAADLSCGRDFLGYRVPRPCRTYLLNAEDGPAQLRDRFAQLQPDRSRVFLDTADDLQAQALWPHRLWRGQPSWLERTLETLQPDVLILDNLTHFVGGQHNEGGLVLAFCHALRTWVSRYPLAVIVAAHPRKRAPDGFAVALHHEHFFEEVMGSSIVINVFGSLWGLEREEDDLVHFRGGRQRAEGTERQLALSYDKDTGRFTIASDPDARLLALRRICGTAKRRATWNALPDPPETFQHGLSRQAYPLRGGAFSEFWRELQQQGLIVSTKDGFMKGLAYQFPSQS